MLLERGLSETHGMPGAISFLHLNDQLRVYPSSDKPLHRFGLEWAAMAIMMHDMGKIYGKATADTVEVKTPQIRLSFDRDPLSFVMSLTDLIQDFARPDATFLAGKANTTTVGYGHRCHGIRLIWDNTDHVLRIIYQYKRYQDYIANKTLFLPESQRLYFDPLHGYLDPGSLWIKRILLEAEHIS
jgi:hypothetical protein